MRDRTLGAVFDPTCNSLTFLRLVLALAVVFSHAFPLGGFGHDWLYRHAETENLGTLAVSCFFVLSGFLVARSWVGLRSPLRYLWHRSLRIFPGYWVCLVVTAFVFSPILYLDQHGSLAGFLTAAERPWYYVLGNSDLEISAGGVAGVVTQATGHAIPGWNISIWTLVHEFRCYLLVALLGLCGAVDRRRAGVLAVVAVLLVVRSVDVVRPDAMGTVHPFFASFWPVRLTLNFAVGVLLFAYRDRVVMSGRAALAATVLLALLMPWSLYWLAGPFLVGYLVMYAGSRRTFRFWDALGDYSYGVYLYGSVVEQLLVAYGLHELGLALYVGLAMLGSLLLAVPSYWLVERPCLRLKSIGRGHTVDVPTSPSAGPVGIDAARARLQG